MQGAGGSANAASAYFPGRLDPHSGGASIRQYRWPLCMHRARCRCSSLTGDSIAHPPHRTCSSRPQRRRSALGCWPWTRKGLRPHRRDHRAACGDSRPELAHCLAWTRLGLHLGHRPEGRSVGRWQGQHEEGEGCVMADGGDAALGSDVDAGLEDSPSAVTPVA